MINIEINNFDFRSFVSGIPNELVENAQSYISKINGTNDMIEFIVLVGQNALEAQKSSEAIGAKFEDMGFGYGIITIKASDFSKIADIKGVQYLEFPKVLTTNDIQSNNASCIPPVWQTYNLSGNGVLIGFIDTGIDYTHPAFIDASGKTRIKYIYDLYSGVIYNEQQINSAIVAKNPQSIVPAMDFAGHGTAVASIAAGGGNIDQNNYGVAYEASIIMVKITGEGKFTSALSTQLMRGLKFLIDKSNELSMPLTINISLSTNDGAHNGKSLIEKYIQEYSQIQKVAVVIAAGNEGETGHHYSGNLDSTNTIYLNIGGGETNITFQIYKPALSDISIELVTPSGASTGIVQIEEGVVRKRIGGQVCTIYFSGPKPFDINGEISINIKPIASNIEMGEWNLNIKNTNQYSGIFDIWLPIAAALNKSTQFLQPDPFNTLGIPATVQGVISVGSYNYTSNNYSAFSGRGIQRIGCVQKPDIVAPGENIMAAIPGGGFGPDTGTSVAAPQVTGTCALILQWGIVQNNDAYLFAEKLKYYLIKGASRTRTDVTYPSRRFGYGYLCAQQTMTTLIADDNTAGIYSSQSVFASEEENMKSEERLLTNSNDNALPSDVIDTSKNQNNQKSNFVEKGKYVDLESKCTGVFGKTTKQYYLTDGFVDFLIQYEGDLIAAIEKMNDIASAFALDENYAIISVKSEDYRKVLLGVKEIVYVDSGGIYTLEGISPLEASGAIQFQYNPYLNLTGYGTIVGIVDTGIDYLNDNFINANGTTRILKIWDQEIENGPTGENLFFGSEYNSDYINKAIQAKKDGKDPYAIVPSKDNNGHGTAMASLVAGSGKNKGPASEAEIVMVKLKPANKQYRTYYATDDKTRYQYRNTDLLLAIKYLFNLSKTIIKPMVIYIPLGTTIGSHDGSSVIEKYIDDVSDSRGVVVVTSTGNQGGGNNHTSGVIDKKGDSKKIELNIGKNQSSIIMQIYCTKPDKMGLSIISPSGEVVNNITPKSREGTSVNFVYEGTNMNVMFIEPDEMTGDEVITIKADNIRQGIWVFELLGEYIVNGRYDAWLVQRELLEEDTIFLSPTQYTTLTLPATSRNIIAAAHYNQTNNATVALSGRGYTRDGRVKPIVTAGGINAMAAAPNNSEIMISGGSVAGAILAGCCSLILQWGIVNKNDLTMYSMKIQTYIMRGTEQRQGDTYPNEQWGYGILNMQKLFDNIMGLPLSNSKSIGSSPIGLRSSENESDKKDDEIFDEFSVGNLYIRKPSFNHRNKE